ncbi:MAG: hypothetical protein D6683_01610 [Actinomyces sp.]|nr:MAG: hypothetical protein D6683_01610 [Actinomyces sp.]
MWRTGGGLTLLVAVVEPAPAAAPAVLFVPGIGPGAAGERGLAFRRPGVWFDAVVEEPDRRWSLGLEAFGLVVDPGSTLDESTRGHRVPLGLDLDVERIGLHAETAAGEGGAGATGWPVRVDGVVAVGADGVEEEAAEGRVSSPLVPTGGAATPAGGALGDHVLVVAPGDGRRWGRRRGPAGWGPWEIVTDGPGARRRG